MSVVIVGTVLFYGYCFIIGVEMVMWGYKKSWEYKKYKTIK
tara:strand:- start:800 stop:922 length:123 start_codon:yes stop_codon:yes gene_type:complete